MGLNSSFLAKKVRTFARSLKSLFAFGWPTADGQSAALAVVVDAGVILKGDDHRRFMANTCVQATLGVPSIFAPWILVVHFPFFSWSCCVLCVLSDTWVFRSMMFMFCVKEADYTLSFGMYHAQCSL